MLAVALVFCAFSSVGADEEGSASPYQRTIEPILIEYCYDCHGDGSKRGNMALDDFTSEEDLLSNHDLWLAVLKNVRAGVMPPANRRQQPSEEEKEVLADWIKREAFRIDPANPDPGRVTVRRLNRIEYRNTIRDLMGVDYNTLEEFPPDDTGYGFDTIGDVLTLSPLLLEKYVQAADTIVTEAVPTKAYVMPEQTIPGEGFRGEDSKRGNRLSFYEDARVTHGFRVDQPGAYRMIVNLDVAGDFDFDPGRCAVVFRVNDDERIQEEFAWHNNKRFQYQFEEQWAAGTQDLALELKALVPVDQQRKPLNLRVASVRVEGPLDPALWKPTRGYDRFFFKGQPPETGPERLAYAREVLEQFTTRAFRRPVDERTLERLVGIAESVYSEPDVAFEHGVRQAMVAVLASPRFLFRIEETESGRPEEPNSLVDEYALASRLSYFLWSSMPDEELFELAARRELRRDLAAQVERMLRDPRSEALIENFAGQWLQARDVEGVSLNPRAVFRREGVNRRFDLDRSLRLAMRRETEMYFGHIVREDRSILELLDSDYTFLDEKLAEFYGIPDVKGREMRRVLLPPDSPRGGVLTQGTVLTVTSNPTRTSPVKRGLFILDNILGTPAPPAPPDIPELEEAEKEFTDRQPTMREAMEAHRSNPLCHSCHARMDPLGLALENFNALGLWRETERNQEIDASGRLITGESFKDIRELKRILVRERRLDFYRCLSEKLLTYALGRGLEHYDVHTVDQMVERLQRDEGRSGALLLGIIESAPFQKRRNQTGLADAASSGAPPQLVQTTSLP